MKLTLSEIVIVFLVLSSFQSLSQEVKTKNWTFLVSSGAAIPIGSYAKANASDAALYFPEPPNFLLGFDKSKSGFAKVGYYINAEIKFGLKNGLFFLFRGGKIVNTIETDGLSMYLTSRYGQQEVEHDKYDMNYYAPGIGFSKSYKSFNFGLSLFAGYSSCKYPYYKSVLLYTTTDPKIIWAHDGERPILETLTKGSSVFLEFAITPRLNIGMECTYQSADFDYKMSNRMIPGGSNVFEIEDTLKVKLINIGLSLGYKF